MGSPNLTEEEGTLALYAYHRIGPESGFSDQHPAVQWLSKALQRLGIHDPDLPEDQEFRSPSGLASRIRQYRYVDRGRREDAAGLYQDVWDKYNEDWGALRRDARQILHKREVDPDLIPDPPEKEGPKSKGEPGGKDEPEERKEPHWTQSIEHVNSDRSSFCPPVREALAAQVEGFVMQETVALSLDAEKDGYPGDVVVEIDPGCGSAFRTDWSGSDPSRFPARIRAAATALREEQRYGRYRIVHEKGDLLIEPLRD